MVRFGADQIFKTKSATITEEEGPHDACAGAEGEGGMVLGGVVHARAAAMMGALAPPDRSYAWRARRLTEPSNDT